MLAAAGRRSGCLARRHRVVRDDQRGLAAVHEAMPGAGMLVTSGGVSMGRRAGCRQGCPCRNEAQTPSARWPCSRACRKASARPGRRASRSSCCQEIRPARPYRSASSSRRPWTPSKVFSPEPPATARAILTSPVQSAPDKRSFLTGILAARARIAGAECPDGLARSAAVIVTRGLGALSTGHRSCAICARRYPARGAGRADGCGRRCRVATGTTAGNSRRARAG